MRPYRAKRKDNKEWVYGWYTRRSHKDCCVYHYIYTGDYFEDKDREGTEVEVYEVDPATVGQSIGVKAAKSYHKDLEIHEGDIIESTTFDHNGVGYQHKGEVKWLKEDYCWMWGEVYLWCAAKDDALEIIGNIHDNPELRSK